jgi:hypothetical protein
VNRATSCWLNAALRMVDPAWRRELLKASVRALLSVACYRQGERVNGNRNQPNYLSTMEPGKGGDWGGDPASDQSGVWEEY